jgi:hypothetical protein
MLFCVRCTSGSVLRNRLSSSVPALVVCAGEENAYCQALIEAHKACLRMEGFNVSSSNSSNKAVAAAGAAGSTNSITVGSGSVWAALTAGSAAVDSSHLCKLQGSSVARAVLS